MDHGYFQVMRYHIVAIHFIVSHRGEKTYYYFSYLMEEIAENFNSKREVVNCQNFIIVL